jgi:hypothetical protein
VLTWCDGDVVDDCCLTIEWYGFGLQSDTTTGKTKLLPPVVPLVTLLQSPVVQYAVKITAPHVRSSFAFKQLAVPALMFKRLLVWVQIGRVEVVRDGVLESVVFRIPPCVVRCKHDAEIVEHRNKIVFEVERDNPFVKLDSFVDMSCKLNKRCGRVPGFFKCNV